ncbi:conserved hypothetical protein [Candidatus Sulfopaludibacter sp. SbA4]|nr:conserved hypothetical protein [Candidatus Sulfopaludibacter sp. SbA4]
MVKVPRSFADKTLWPEYLELTKALDEYLNEATERIIREEVYRDERIIREEVYRDARDAPERAG